MAAGDKYINKLNAGLSTSQILRELVREDENGKPFLKTNFIPYTFDADSLAFISAAGIIDETEQLVVDFIVKSLKGEDTSYNPSGLDLWTNMKVFYPFIGGTASAHKFNLKDPRDLDAAFRIVWSGGLTHSNMGVQGNMTNGYGNTKLNPFTHLSINSYSHGRYVNLAPLNAHGTNYADGAFSTAGGNKGVHEFGLSSTAQASGVKINHLTSGEEFPGRLFFTVGTPFANALGSMASMRSSTTFHKGYGNGVSYPSPPVAFNPVTGSVTALPNAEFLIGATSVDAGAPVFYSNMRFCCRWFSGYSTENEVLAIVSIINQAQTMLGRNVY